MAEHPQLYYPATNNGKDAADVLLGIRIAQINQLYYQTIGGLLGGLVRIRMSLPVLFFGR